MSTVAMADYRNARRRSSSLLATAHAIDEAIGGHLEPGKFVTGVLAELDLASGSLTWHLAGHPAPLLLRSGRVVKTLVVEPDLPFGIGGPRSSGQERLVPSDRLLLFTDGGRRGSIPRRWAVRRREAGRPRRKGGDRRCACP